MKNKVKCAWQKLLQFLGDADYLDRWRLVAGIPTFLFAGLFVFFLHRLELSKLHAHRPPGAVSRKAAENMDPTQPSESKSSLTETILAIVQSYYVDEDRGDPERILQSTLEELAKLPQVSYTMNDDWVILTIRGQRYELPLQHPLSLIEVANFLREVAPHFDDPTDAGMTRDVWPPSGVLQVLNALMAGLDPHSSLLTPDMYKELRQGTDGSFGGLGVIVGFRDLLLTVVKPMPHSPAMRAGVRKNDRILSINGMNTFGYPLDHLIDFMRGDPGTMVDLTLLRDNEPAPFHVKLKREVIQVDSVTSTEVRDGANTILHATIDSFSSRTAKELWNAIKAAKEHSNNRLEGLVMDLRSNPGGLLDQAVQVADIFLDNGTIVSTKGRREEVETADKGFDEMDYPIIVLMDPDSASASEIVAGALQDHERALVIGQPSFGKGSVQTIFELPADYALKLTIARYYTPLGRSIQNVGITPDIWLQPVYQKEKNENMLGSYRYKSERFLQNHLEANSLGPNLHNDSDYLGYYLRDKSENMDEHKGPDREMELAVRVIKRVARSYGTQLPEGAAQHAGHWLALASRDINAFIEHLDKRTVAWLNKAQHVNWHAYPTASHKIAAHPDNLRLTVTRPVPRTLMPGDTMALPILIENISDVPEPHLSAFIRSDKVIFETNEKLIGMIPPHAKVEEQIELQIPPFWEPGTIAFEVGMAEDGQILSKLLQKFNVEILPKQSPTLRADVSVVKPKGRDHTGVLTAKEDAQIRVTLWNDGRIDGHNLKAQLINLSGKQISLDMQPQSIPLLQGGHEISLNFSVKGADSILTEELPMGLVVTCKDLDQPLRKHVFIRGQPTQSGDKKNATLGH